MKISTVPIHHTIKHLQPIFTITKSSKYFASGGMNGEMKLWNLEFEHIKTIKKHSSSVSCIKFSKDEKYIASSGDDGKVFIFDSDSLNVIKVVKHKCDITHIEWSSDFIISVDLDGQMVLTKIGNQEFIEFRKFFDHKESILGLNISPNGKYVCTYSESKIVLYEDFNIISTTETKKGTILENLNSKISFAPNNKFVSIGMQFNKKHNTVGIFDLNLKCVYSLVGHVAPSEITAFCPKVFKNIQKYYILAAASQDCAISLWNTFNPKPFILIRNFTESPILDMFWDDLTLYTCSYDGIVKRIEFNKDELGEIIVDEDQEQNFELPFAEKNIELQLNYEKRIEKLDFNETLNLVRLEPFTINGKTLEEACQEADLEAKREEQNKMSKATDESKNITQDPSKIPKRENIQDKIELSKPKRIQSTMVDPVKQAPIQLRRNQSNVVFFDTNLPEKIKLEKSKPFTTNIDDFCVVFDNDLSVFRNKQPFYKIKGPFSKVCANRNLLVVYSSHIQVYDLKTGVILLPFIACRISFLDVLGKQILFVDSYGDFTVIDLKNNRTTVGKLPKTKHLSNVQLNKRYFLLAEYSSTGEIIFYNKNMKVWFSVNPNFNSITSAGIDFFNDNDETLVELEVSFAHYKMVNDYKNMSIVARQIICLIRKLKTLDDCLEYKIENILQEFDNDIIELLLEEMNRENFLQKFVVKMCNKFNLK